MSDEDAILTFLDGIAGFMNNEESRRSILIGENQRLRDKIAEQAYQMAQADIDRSPAKHPAGDLPGTKAYSFHVPLRWQHFDNDDYLRYQIEHGYESLVRTLVKEMDRGKHYTIQLFESAPNIYALAEIRRSIGLVDIDPTARQELMYMEHDGRLAYTVYAQISPVEYREIAFLPEQSFCDMMPTSPVYEVDNMKNWSSDKLIKWVAGEAAERSMKSLRQRVRGMARMWRSHMDRMEREREEFEG